MTGKVSVSGSIALTTQEPWIQNGTIRENILFGSDFENKKYYETIHCCGLAEDLTSLPHGDQTLIGDRGINLSGK